VFDVLLHVLLHVLLRVLKAHLCHLPAERQRPGGIFVYIDNNASELTDIGTGILQVQQRCAENPPFALILEAKATTAAT